MPIDKRIASAAAALADVADGSVVLIGGFGGAGFPNSLIRALRLVAPRDLTLVVNSATHRYSLTHELIAAGLVRKVIASSGRGHDPGLSPFERLLNEGRIEFECVPQGTFTERIRAGGAGIPAFFTPTGFGTALAAGKETRCFQGRECVLETAITGDLALIRADCADRFGNLSFRFAQMNFGPAMACAARLAVAEVREICEHQLPPERVQLPGIFIDHVVVAERI